MNEDRTTQLIDYLEDRLPAGQRQALEAQLAASESLRRELAALNRVLSDMEEVSPEQPSPELRRRFYHFLEEERRGAASPPELPGRWVLFPLRRTEWSVAAAVALLVIGIGFGMLWQRNLKQQRQINELVSEVQQTRKMMVLSMLEERSASQRIKALNTVQEQRSSVDDQVIDALINTLNTDDNVNVRTKAAEALLQFAGYPGVVPALIRSLDQQEHPEVQITLIEVLVASRARGAVNELQKMMEREELMEVVRYKAAAGVEQLM
jgi:anti-sigma-K factor RskA